jgi:hypothetical protein
MMKLRRMRLAGHVARMGRKKKRKKKKKKKKMLLVGKPGGKGPLGRLSILLIR